MREQDESLLQKFSTLSLGSRLLLLQDPYAHLDQRARIDVAFHNLLSHESGFVEGGSASEHTLAGELPGLLANLKAQLDSWWESIPPDIRSELLVEHDRHLPAKYYHYLKKLSFVEVYRLEKQDGSNWDDHDFRVSPPLVHDYLTMRKRQEG
ncbi:hypothetical protein CH260_10325 [Rhodococcus sp. 05-2256-B2]|uniref:hypothetical protein n=1 Tax=unclassified Rhodococcus (in: high G+C Gram-positive bacteria) TaxID=192944 RepID=UPI000B9BCBF7|nr:MULTISPECIES: hypothetical protein [unclassified Rhodococcus (in: high G+C Gram-positive bacteria)]OZD81827.1 hypothetical protein CH258_19855 [Rhodococcus sp. 05-2256-B4]OZD90448.1 hypothetical protein CH257_18250 [Rhodococcus sp. 05-2256-B3]OZD96928.1 hypothetical protein CH260_10325 [Rhodococcus sp. 05-2256-B2]OZE00450.1 hypothetical protein CH285_19500 [Rhodococcus sp. 05-2256-B1]